MSEDDKETRQGEDTVKYVPVTPDIATRVLREVLRRLPDGWAIVPIGGTLLAISSRGRLASTTKDVDLVLVAVNARSGAVRVPEIKELEPVAAALSKTVTARPSNVIFTLDTEAGPVACEFIRGERPGKGGRYLTFRVLEAAARLATPSPGEPRVLLIPLEVLAFLKAWAVDDQLKRRARGDGDHAERYEADVTAIWNEFRQSAPDFILFKPMFAAAPRPRRKALYDILVRSGWAMPTIDEFIKT